MTEKPDAKKTPFTEAPTICPLMAMAYGHMCTDAEDIPTLENLSHYGEDVNCRFTKCWFYHRKMKICLIPMGLISLQRIADYLEKLTGKGDLDRTMTSLHRQHRPE